MKTASGRDSTTTRLKNEILHRLDKRMSREQISQGDIAEAIGADGSNLNKIFRRRKTTTLDYLIRMAEAAGMRVEMKVIDP